MNPDVQAVPAGTCATCRNKPAECCRKWGGFVADQAATCEKYEAKAVKVATVNERPTQNQLSLFGEKP